jgi:hypothetical protein
MNPTTESVLRHHLRREAVADSPCFDAALHARLMRRIEAAAASRRLPLADTAPRPSPWRWWLPAAGALAACVALALLLPWWRGPGPVTPPQAVAPVPVPVPTTLVQEHIAPAGRQLAAGLDSPALAGLDRDARTLVMFLEDQLTLALPRAADKP